MNQFSKKEDIKMTSEQLIKLIEQWSIRQRISEKIEVWGIRSTPNKILSIPVNFLANAILYYFVSQLKQSIINYSQDMLLNVSFQLKSIYNGLSMNLFKKTSFFEYTMVILAKLTHYLLTSRFPQLAETKEEIESDLYQSIVDLLIGYEVDSKAYQMILKKYEQKGRDSLQKRSSNKYANDINYSPQSLERGGRSTKKMHRIGMQNLFQTNGQDKNIQKFRLEVHQALHIKKKTIFCDIVKEGQKKTSYFDDGPKSIGQMGWLKGKNKLLNINQVSAAMSIYTGMDLHTKTTNNIHLSKRRKLKEYYFGIPKAQKQPERSTMPLSEVIVNSPKNKDWSLIVSSLKQKSEHISMRETTLELKAYKFPTKTQSNFKLKPRINEFSYQKIDSTDQYEVDFRKLKNGEDESIHCNTQQTKVRRQQLSRKSTTTLFVRDRGQFQKACVKRKQQFQYNSIYLPKLDKF